MKAIQVKDVSKKYKLYGNTKEKFLDLILPKEYGKKFYALEGINFTANKGEVIGFVGINGSGKSTLSNIIAGIVPETTGEITINGEVSIIAVAAGLNNELSGRDNIELKLIMLGFNKREIQELEKSIIDFSELGEFIDQPVKSYSSGMKSRLGFSISVNVDPEILIIDEALSVGDRAFAEKSYNKMMEFKEKGKTMIFVSHSLGQMRTFCDKILWLEFGKVKEFGKVNKVLMNYERFLNIWRDLSKEEREAYKRNPNILESFANDSKETLISSIAHLKSKNVIIYQDYKETQKKKLSAEPYIHSAYFVRKKVSYKGIEFLLLSHQPSYQKELIGWVKREDLRLKNDLLIDNDDKKVNIPKGTKFYKKPWGGKVDLVNSQNETREKCVAVNQTRKIGRETWYKISSNELWFSVQI